MTTIEQKKMSNYKLFFDTIKDLSKSQGFYYRLFKQLISVDIDEDKRIELINKLPDFKDSVDVILWLEQ